MSMLEDDLGDWRIRLISTLAEDFKASDEKTFEEGSTVALESVTKGENGDLFAFIAPSGPALALNVSINSSKRSKELKDEIEYDSVKKSLGGETLRSIKRVKGQEKLYQYLEESMIAVVFALQALEVFCNLVIAEDAETPYEVKREEETKEFSQEELQRYCSIEEKLATILPDIWGVKTPKGRAMWADFKDLVRVRNSVIHTKSHETYTKTEIEEESLFYELLHHEVVDFPKHAIDMIEYFHVNRGVDRPRWFKGAWDKYNNTFIKDE